MTSSYNIDRRSREDPDFYRPTNWEAHQKNGGVCPPDFLTVPISHDGVIRTDWKICVPKPSLKINDAERLCNKGPDETVVIDEKRYVTNDLYDIPNDEYISQSRTNAYPPESRQYSLQRPELYRKDYFRQPLKFDGTGYHPVRERGGWDSPEFTTDIMDPEPIQYPGDARLNPTTLIPRDYVKAQAQKELIRRKMYGLTPYARTQVGNFYGFNKFLNY